LKLRDRDEWKKGDGVRRVGEKGMWLEKEKEWVRGNEVKRGKGEVRERVAD